jgi:hypothetical protein
MAGAPIGNENRRKGTRWHDALNKALARYTSATVKPGEALDRIAIKIVQAAVEKGDRDAINEIANRLDGKPAQGITIGGEEDNPVKVNHRIEFIDGEHTDSPEAKAAL